MSYSHKTSIFFISDASAIDSTPYRVWEPRMKGRWIFDYTAAFGLFVDLAEAIDKL